MTIFQRWTKMMYLKDVSVFTWFLFNRLLYSLNIIQSSQLQNSILSKYDIFRVKIYIFIKFKEINIKKNISYFSDIVRYATLAQLWLYCKVSGQFTFILSLLQYYRNYMRIIIKCLIGLINNVIFQVNNENIVELK